MGGACFQLVVVPVGTGAMFNGRLDPSLPTDMSAKHSGYCAIRSKPKKVSVVPMSKIHKVQVALFSIVSSPAAT